MILDIENNEYYDNIFQHIKKLIENNPYCNIIIYSNNCDKLFTYNIPILHIKHAKFFNGNLILFDIVSLVISKHFTNLNKKILYVDSIPWLKNRNNTFNEWKNLYNNDIDFIAANQYLFDVYSMCWKKPLEIMENFNHEKLQQILQ